MHSDLINAYRWRRQQAPVRGYGPDTGALGFAHTALAMARHDVATGQKRYPAAPLALGRFKPQPPPLTGLRYFESAEQGGFRVVGFADEISRLDHEGWYSDDCQEATFRGAVLQIPGRKGEARFLAAYQESDNGGFVVEIGPGDVFREARKDGCSHDSSRDLGAARDAALAADSFAEREAEKERNYRDAWSAGSQWAELGEEVKAARTAALAILAERRGLPALEKPALCAAIRARVDSLIEEMSAARKKRQELTEYIWPDYHAAFNDGAGQTVLAV
jgi:hypothetical protein